MGTKKTEPADTDTDKPSAKTDPEAPTAPKDPLFIESSLPGRVLVGELWVEPGRHSYERAVVEANKAAILELGDALVLLRAA